MLCLNNFGLANQATAYMKKIVLCGLYQNLLSGAQQPFLESDYFVLRLRTEFSPTSNLLFVEKT